jgi:hypothetical protein
MEQEQAVQLLEGIESIMEALESLMITGYLLAGLITGVLLIFIFFFFLKGAD